MNYFLKKCNSKPCFNWWIWDRFWIPN
jgi:hypothetical protein